MQFRIEVANLLCKRIYNVFTAAVNLADQRQSALTLHHERSERGRLAGRTVQPAVPQIALQLLVQEELAIAANAERIGRIEFDTKREQHRIDVLHLFDDELGQIEPVSLFAAVLVPQTEVVAIVNVQLLANILEQEVATMIGLQNADTKLYTIYECLHSSGTVSCDDRIIMRHSNTRQPHPRISYTRHSIQPHACYKHEMHIISARKKPD